MVSTHDNGPPTVTLADVTEQRTSRMTPGSLVQGHGVYLGFCEVDRDTIMDAYAEPDLLRDTNGNVLVLKFEDALKELSNRNSGRQYGDGLDRDLERALREGTYHNGDWVLPPRPLLDGKDLSGHLVRPDQNVSDLLQLASKQFTHRHAPLLWDASPVNCDGLGGMRTTILRSAKRFTGAVWSSTEVDYRTAVEVNLRNGYAYFNPKETNQANILPVRLYKRSPAPRFGG